jgi:hypothetical protein
MKKDKMAFPDPLRGGEQTICNQTPSEEDSGMTLRDYIASKVISKIVEFDSDGYKMLHGKSTNLENLFDNSAKTAYQIADAMLRVRG